MISKLNNVSSSSVPKAGASPASPTNSTPAATTDVDPAAQEFDTDINYNVDRKADVSVPGTVNPNEAVGINNKGQIAANGDRNGSSRALLLTPIYRALVQQPIHADGSSVFSAKRGIVPVKFAVTKYGKYASCTLPATISVTRAAHGTLTSVDESTYSKAEDNGSNFRITGCRYHYNLAARSLGVGTYRVDISIKGIMVGHAVFALK